MRPCLSASFLSRPAILLIILCLPTFPPPIESQTGADTGIHLLHGSDGVVSVGNHSHHLNRHGERILTLPCSTLPVKVEMGDSIDAKRSSLPAPRQLPPVGGTGRRHCSFCFIAPPKQTAAITAVSASVMRLLNKHRTCSRSSVANLQPAGLPCVPLTPADDERVPEAQHVQGLQPQGVGGLKGVNVGAALKRESWGCYCCTAWHCSVRAGFQASRLHADIHASLVQPCGCFVVSSCVDMWFMHTSHLAFHCLPRMTT